MPARPRRDALATTLSNHRIRNAAIAQRIVASTGLAPPVLVIEAGAGNGMLTAELAARGLDVVAIERDRAAWEALRARFAGQPHVSPILGDFLQLTLPTRRPYVIFGNPPFAATSAILRRALSARPRPSAIYLVLQREAAFRWAGFDRESLPSIETRMDYTAEVRLALRRRDFDPPPAVDCVLLALVRRPRPLLTGPRRVAFLALVTRALATSRRTAARALEERFRAPVLAAAARRARVNLDVAPGGVTFEEWLRLFAELHQVPTRSSAHPRPSGRAISPATAIVNPVDP